MKPKLLLTILLLLSIAANAQRYAITGIIKSAAGVGIESATVFLAGSQRATITDATGQFNLSDIAPGNYELMISMVGHAPIKKNIAIKDKSAYLDTVMQIKAVVLNEVKIGNGSLPKDYFKTFMEAFLGTSANARSCIILNPEVIEFSTSKKVLKAYTDDFLIIENTNLGYRLKYLLRSLEIYVSERRAVRVGEAIFEEIPGTDEQNQKWAKNRRETYEGSVMNYLRAVYAQRTREEGFITYQLTSIKPPLKIDPNPIIAEQVIDRLDSNFFKFKDSSAVYVIYDKKKAAKEDVVSTKKEIRPPYSGNYSFLRLNVLIDKNGAYPSIDKYWLYGNWGYKRLGDQLPSDYHP